MKTCRHKTMWWGCRKPVVCFLTWICSLTSTRAATLSGSRAGVSNTSPSLVPARILPPSQHTLLTHKPAHNHIHNEWCAYWYWNWKHVSDQVYESWSLDIKASVQTCNIHNKAFQFKSFWNDSTTDYIKTWVDTKNRPQFNTIYIAKLHVCMYTIVTLTFVSFCATGKVKCGGWSEVFVPQNNFSILTTAGVTVGAAIQTVHSSLASRRKKKRAEKEKR